MLTTTAAWPRTRVHLVVALLLTSSCGGPRFSVQRFTPMPPNATVSFFGISVDASMSVQPTTDVLPGATDLERCEWAYDAALVASHPDLAASIESTFSQLGVTQDTLALVAPAALGDDILSISIADGRLVTETVGGGKHKPTKTRVKRSGYAIRATLYSIRAKQIIVELTMNSDGDFNDDLRATRQFVDRLAKEIPVTSCVGWRWNEMNSALLTAP